MKCRFHIYTRRNDIYFKNTHSGSVNIITYYVVKGREIILNTSEIIVISKSNRKEKVYRYEKIEMILSSNELN